MSFITLYVLNIIFSSHLIFSDTITEERRLFNTHVWITVSSLAGRNKQTNQQYERQIELNWRDAPQDTGDDWIGLFDYEPINSNVKTMGRKSANETVSIQGNRNGSYRTEIQFPYQVFKKQNITSSCLTYWTALISNKQIVAKNCIRNNPFWMSDNLETIGNKSIINLLIPGTHNAGSFDKYSYDNDNLFRKYSLCHDENVWNQLIYGIRFLDLRVSYDTVKNRSEKFWIVHGPVRMKSSLNEIIAQVKDFVEIAPKEIVIIDFHRFEKGFDRREASRDIIKFHHQLLIAAMVRTIGNYMIPAIDFNANTTVNDLINSNKRIIVGYDSGGYIEHELLIPAVKHLWPKTDNITKLEKFFNDTLGTRHRNTLRAAMAELTAENIKLISDRYRGLRTMAQQVNYKITEWFDHRWPKYANIIATDYFLGNNIIEVAIKHNTIL